MGDACLVSRALLHLQLPEAAVIHTLLLLPFLFPLVPKARFHHWQLAPLPEVCEARAEGRYLGEAYKAAMCACQASTVKLAC